MVPDTAVIKRHWMSLVMCFLFYQSALHIFLEMEFRLIIKEDNVTVLIDVFQKFRPDVKKKIDAKGKKKKAHLFNLLLRTELGPFVGFMASSLAA